MPLLSRLLYLFFSSRRRHTRFDCDWSSDVCSSDLLAENVVVADFQPGGLAFVFAVLRRAAKDAIRVENVVAADGRLAGDGHAVLQLAEIGRASCRGRV